MLMLFFILFFFYEYVFGGAFGGSGRPHSSLGDEVVPSPQKNDPLGRGVSSHPGVRRRGAEAGYGTGGRGSVGAVQECAACRDAIGEGGRGAGQGREHVEGSGRDGARHLQ